MQDALKELCDYIHELIGLRENFIRIDENWEKADKGEKWTNHWDEREKIRKDIYKSLVTVDKMKCMQLEFIDDQIKSKINSSLKDIDSLDDVRLLLLEKLERASGNEILSVLKLCSDPVVKIISQKNIIRKNFTDSARVMVMDNEKSREVLDDSNVSTTRGVFLESDVLETFDFPSTVTNHATMVVKITTKDEIKNLFDLKVVLKSEKDWEMCPTSVRGGYIQFPVRPMKYLFVISTERWQPYALSPEGLNYKSDIVEEATVTFPACSVSQAYEIEIQVMPPNPEAQTAINDPDDITDIISVSARVWVRHDDELKFQKPVSVTLPLPSAPSTKDDTELCLVEWTEDDDVQIYQTNLCVHESYCKFDVDGFSGKCAARLRRRRKSTQWKTDIKEYFSFQRGLSKNCTIVVFTDRSAVHTLWVEIVESKRIEDLLKLRSKQQLVQITNTMSKTIVVRYGQSIKVDARGSIRVPLHYHPDYMQIKFTGKEESCNIRFQVEIVDTSSSAVLEFRLGKKQVHVCPFEAEEWLRQRSGTSQPHPKFERQASAFFFKNQTLCVRSLQVLSKQIPVQQVKELAIELGLSNNEVEHLKACGFRGMELILEILLKWRHKCHKEADDMVSELATALNELSLNDLASILLKASKGQKCLETEYFAK